jgi:outer membrane protein assembly factor BamE (lipoprotein component of BamABCDE complex)
MKTLKLNIAICAIALSMSACAADVNTRGNIVSDAKIAQVKPNVTTQYDVSRLLGPPTLVSPFAEDQTWYYAGRTSERLGVFKHEVKERRVVRIDFDDTGVVTQVSELDPNSAQDVNFVDRRTPTAGKEYTLLQQLIGNVGRFNSVGSVAERAN